MAHYYLAYDYDYPVLGTFWTLLCIFVWVIWLGLIFRVVIDLFRDRELSGWAKAGWLFLVLVLPFVGVFVYLIARGQNMAGREIQHAREQQELVNTYIRDTAAGTSTGTEDLIKLSELKARGDISEEEFQRAKERILR
ncbi:SHOCT domain-containing protein [Frankia sp. QA3]|uniref:SHOCT domain-containing protein n=1 Tax=Frankia sp. QA3 TaxID=710111 RepID=UPI000269C486|nr:SHOCT domain-containing protein [Frankia sp. QA3]EIV94327.1 hypothetical protein FraQA3DRAFT_4074 [Frankia sp. QA3]